MLEILQYMFGDFFRCCFMFVLLLGIIALIGFAFESVRDVLVAVFARESMPVLRRIDELERRLSEQDGGK